MKNKIVGTFLSLAAFLLISANSAKAAANIYRVEVSTPVDTAILLTLGPGALYGVDCSSGATTGFAMAFDSSTSSGITFTSLGKAITPTVFGNANTASSVPNANWRAGTGNEAVLFVNGLVALTHGTAMNCLFKVGPSNGSLP